MNNSNFFPSKRTHQQKKTTVQTPQAQPSIPADKANNPYLSTKISSLSNSLYVP